ncbi:ferrous iron transport protein B [Longimicrobium terrae]|uniref:Ferrous iron transport protein B n=1 Tax=Longimicrobium terrae TaxID=1639882 RepID=A0A841H7A7_9BACT|nr:ferrous iron transport protein B [Longimicrobium terrae]MBB4639496.1 ferrous iron transport protein B [Longimicrobium terrae]MBB6073868.1 ferrous iron transport protein B [Longimicrobium terrae]NNC32544.1 ferrous iron transport protein B [Longimicrobium terrae]
MEEAAAGIISAPAAPSPAEAPRGGGVLHVALIGNPNTGKSTLFNALTGMRQRVGNYSGVTVERVEGRYRDADGPVVLLDLPGTYSLSASSPDEEIALAVLTGHADGIGLPDVVIVVVDAANLERNLFLASQVLELGLPTVIALNQVDAAEAAGIRIDAVELTLELGAPVVPIVATRGQGLDVLRSAVRKAIALPRPARQFELPPEAAAALAPLEARLTAAGFSESASGLESLRLLAVQQPGRHVSHVAGLEAAVAKARARIEEAGLHPTSLEAESRYGWIAGVVDNAVHRSRDGARTITDRIDAVMLHRVAGPLIFLLVMAMVFQSIFTWAEPMIGWVEGLFGALGGAVAAALPPGDLNSLIVDGVIAGVGSVLVFLPQITILFLFLGILEDTGYMARAAFIMDRFMRSVGLHGRSFIPLLSGYACAVPGIMATRTIESRKDRLATIMVLPLMSCSARIPIYALLIGTFIPSVAVAGVFNLQGLTLLGMYLLGTVTALLVASIFKRTLLKGQTRPMIMELPPYRLPRPRSLALSVGHRASMFLRKAGTVILALSIVLWALATYPKTDAAPGMSDEQAQEAALAHSALGRMGHVVEPLVAPLGYDWKIGVGILSSFAAREVFVSTMGTIYGVGGDADEGSTTLREKLRAETHAGGAVVYTPLVAVGLMVFYVFAMMCMSTTAVVVRETGGGWAGARWAAFQFAWMLALAYGSALLVYQGGRLMGWG